jgi:hypothetical protein
METIQRSVDRHAGAVRDDNTEGPGGFRPNGNNRFDVVSTRADTGANLASVWQEIEL